MPHGVRALLALFAALIVIAAVGTSPLGDPTALERLRGLPIERRQALAGNLKRFEALGPKEREAIALLDASLAALPAEERERYFELARRYHLWLSGLSDSRRKALAEADPARRIALVEQYREEERREAFGSRPDDPIWTYSPAFNPTTFGEEALQTRCWQELKDSERVEVLAETAPQKRVALLMKMTSGRPRLRRDEYPHIAAEMGAFVKRYNDETRKFNEDLAAKRPERKGNFAPALRPNWAALEPAIKLKTIRKLEDRHFHAHQPPAVSAHELAHFEASLPPWIRERIAALPPDAARWRLTILHDLAAPNPGVEAKPPASKRPSPPPSPKTSHSKAFPGPFKTGPNLAGR